MGKLVQKTLRFKGWDEGDLLFPQWNWKPKAGDSLAVLIDEDQILHASLEEVHVDPVVSDPSSEVK